MITARLRRNITSLCWRNSLYIEKSNCSFWPSLLHLSTVGEPREPLKTPTVYEFLLHKHSFSPEVATYVDSVLNLAEKPAKCDSLLSYFKEIGFSQSELERTLKIRPRLLLASVEKIIKPKIKIFQDLGFSSKDIISLISRDPAILHYSAKNTVVPSLLLLKDLLGSYKEVARVLRKSGWFLTRDLEKIMVPNIEFLKSYGIPMDQILVLLNYLPRLLLYKPEVLRKCVEKVDQMGVRRDSRNFVYAVGSVGSLADKTRELKLQAFRNILEFSDEDISRLLNKYPKVFAVSVEKMKKLKEVVLETGKYNTSSICKCPGALEFSIEKRIKPRFQVLAILERRHRINKWPSLRTLSRLSDAKFFDLFVGPYLDDPTISMLYKDNQMIQDGKPVSAA